MSTLVSLAADCVANLLEYLSGEDIHALLSSGDRILRAKLVHNITALNLRVRHNEQFPFSALELPHLHSLVVIGSFLSYLRFDKEEIDHATLQKPQNARISLLHLEFANASEFFLRNGSLSLSQRFSSLRDLTLRCFANDNFIDSLAHLPHTLTKLDLDTPSHSLSELQMSSKLNINAISKLPPSLWTLTIRWHSISAVESKEIDLEGLLPPNLTSLSLATFADGTMITRLPQSLEKLELFVYSDFDRTRPLATSLLPPNLTILQLNMPLAFDCALPQGLITIEVPDDTYSPLLTLGNGDANWIGLPLPPLIEFPEIPYINMPPPPHPAYSHITRIVRALAHSEQQLVDLQDSLDEGFPRQLLIQKQYLRLLTPLRESITAILLPDSMFGEDVVRLPKYLQKLSIIPGLDLQSSSEPPVWTLQQVSELPKYIRWLTMPFYVVGEGARLAPISNLPLESFVLNEVPWEALEIAPTWLSACLPLYLKALELSVEKDEIDPFSTDIIRLSRLGEVVPHLQTLLLEIPFHGETPMGPMFASLPSNLRCLNMQTRDVFEDSAISFLPKSLEELFLGFDDVESDASDAVMTSRHFKDMPDRLVELHLSLPDNHLIRNSVVEYLPKTLADIEIRSDADNQDELDEAISHFLIVNSPPRYDN